MRGLLRYRALPMGILYAGVVNESRRAMDDFVRAAAAGSADFQGVPVRIVPVKYGKEAQTVLDVRPMERRGENP